MVLVLPEVEMACKVLLVARFNAARDRSSWAGIPNVVGDPLVTHAKAPCQGHCVVCGNSER